jgi:hypothetical protein
MNKYDDISDLLVTWVIRLLFVLGLFMVLAGLWQSGDPRVDDPDFGPPATVQGVVR